MERRLAEEMQGGKKRKPRAGAEDSLASPHLVLFYTVLVQTVHCSLGASGWEEGCHLFSLHLMFPASASRLIFTSAISFLLHNDGVRSRCSCLLER